MHCVALACDHKSLSIYVMRVAERKSGADADKRRFSIGRGAIQTPSASLVITLGRVRAGGRAIERAAFQIKSILAS